MNLETLLKPLRERGGAVCAAAAAAIIIGTVLHMTRPTSPSDSERITALESRLVAMDAMDARLRLQIQEKSQDILVLLSSLSNESKKSACEGYLAKYREKNMEIPGSLAIECMKVSTASPWVESTKSEQVKADEFIAELLPTMTNVDARRKKSVCEYFIGFYQNKNWKVPPAFLVECNF